MDKQDKFLNYAIAELDRDGMFKPKTGTSLGLGKILTSRGPVEAAVQGGLGYLGSRKLAQANIKSAEVKRSSDMYNQELNSWNQRHNKNLDLIANRGLIGKIAGVIGLITDKKPNLANFEFSAGQPVRTETKVISTQDPHEIVAEEKKQKTLDSVQNFIKPTAGEKVSKWVRHLAERNMEED